MYLKNKVATLFLLTQLLQRLHKNKSKVSLWFHITLHKLYAFLLLFTKGRITTNLQSNALNCSPLNISINESLNYLFPQHL